MNSLKALEESKPIWKGLAINGNPIKPFNIWLWDCPCCHYVFKIKNVYYDSINPIDACIDNCPIQWPWDKHKRASNDEIIAKIRGDFCHSLYYDWSNAKTINERRKTASVIYKLICKSIDKLKS